MPITYSIDEATRCVTVVLRGEVSADEYNAHLLQLRDRSVLSYRRLVDAREATVALTSDDVKRFVKTMTAARTEDGTARTAFVVSSDFLFGMLRMYQIRSESVDPGFGVFRDVAEATDWLGAGV